MDLSATEGLFDIIDLRWIHEVDPVDSDSVERVDTSF